MSYGFKFWYLNIYTFGKKICFVFSGPNGRCLQILGSISPKKWTDTQTDRHSIALRNRIHGNWKGEILLISWMTHKHPIHQIIRAIIDWLLSRSKIDTKHFEIYFENQWNLDYKFMTYSIVAFIRKDIYVKLFYL